MKTDKQFVNTLKDIIHIRGAMERLVSDSAQVESTGRVKDILRAYTISNWSSDPHQQHQNPTERKYKHDKSTTNCVMERSGSHASTWLLTLLYVYLLLNHTASPIRNWCTPLERIMGSTQDISPIIRFY